jgi:hypothetical protein
MEIVYLKIENMRTSERINNNLEDIRVNIKIKLSVLWTSVTLFYLYGDYFELYVPQKVEGLYSGEHLLDSPIKLLLASVLLAIPASMVLLSILVRPGLSRWLNIIFGVFFTGIMLLIAFTSFSTWRSFYFFYALLESSITSLIVWYALKWPQAKGT